MENLLRDPFLHLRPVHLCGMCGAPDDIVGISCFCDPVADGVPPCSTCGAAFGDYDAECAECRRMGRVDVGLERFLDPCRLEPLREPVTAFTAEEPLPLAFTRSTERERLRTCG